MGDPVSRVCEAGPRVAAKRTGLRRKIRTVPGREANAGPAALHLPDCSVALASVAFLLFAKEFKFYTMKRFLLKAPSVFLIQSSWQGPLDLSTNAQCHFTDLPTPPPPHRHSHLPPRHRCVRSRALKPNKTTDKRKEKNAGDDQHEEAWLSHGLHRPPQPPGHPSGSPERLISNGGSLDAPLMKVRFSGIFLPAGNPRWESTGRTDPRRNMYRTPDGTECMGKNNTARGSLQTRLRRVSNGWAARAQWAA